MGKNERKSTKRWFTCADCQKKVFETPHDRGKRRLCEKCAYARHMTEYAQC